MSAMEVTLVLVTYPFAVVLGVWLGRMAQKRMWLYHLPYEERVKAFCRK